MVSNAVLRSSEISKVSFTMGSIGGLINVKISIFKNMGLKTREKKALKYFRNEI